MTNAIREAGIKTRTKSDFGLQASPGLLFLDCDDGRIGRDELRALLLKALPSEWVAKVERYFASHGLNVVNLGAAADASNQSVSLEGLSREHQMLVAGFARVQSSSLSTEDVDAFKRLLQGLQGGKEK